VRAAIESLSPADTIRLRRASLYFAKGPWTAEELRQEALFRAFMGQRKCPKDIGIVQFLVGAMKSIISSEAKSAARAMTRQLEAVGDFNPTDADSGPEFALLEQEKLDRIRTKTLALFDDDSSERIILEGIMEGLEGNELCELAGINSDQLATKRKFIRRRIDGAFPNGLCYD
jgi:DNA-directed RNA polymerase specialized sigma24 family protein